MHFDFAFVCKSHKCQENIDWEIDKTIENTASIISVFK